MVSVDPAQPRNRAASGAGLSVGGDTALLTGTCGGGVGGVWVTFLEHSKHFRDQTI